jgi:hypothetical protein
MDTIWLRGSIGFGLDLAWIWLGFGRGWDKISKKYPPQKKPHLV